MVNQSVFTGETRVEDTVVLVPNAELVGLDLLAFELTTNMCQANQVQTRQNRRSRHC